MRWIVRTGALGVLLGGALAVVAPAFTPSVASAATPAYYIAMGASLAAGRDASSPGKSYVGLVYQQEKSRFRGLQLENISCSGPTTSDVINGPRCGSSTPQLATAEQFLKAHPGQVAFVTIDIDIGADD